jgi:hypothetical protein
VIALVHQPDFFDATPAQVRHVVAVSGGKDSTWLAIALREREPREYVYFCTPTERELPGWKEHMTRLEGLLESPILRIGVKGGLDALIERKGALPNHRARWCTELAKLKPAAEFLAALAPAVQYVGLRADEESRSGMWHQILGVAQRFPLKEWGHTLRDVRTGLAERGIEVPKRQDCDYCFFQRLIEWWELWRDFPERYAEAEGHEAAVSELRGKPYTFRSPQRDTWPAALADLRVEFEKGRIPKETRSALKEAQCWVCAH